jgi:alkanesulfonate monooxygenase SsuD/methylene tetrahydromethanopterin reductase-like flavin-dependent oxidoreductase (luciferase family)
MAASIDDISGGRFVLGLGAGWNEAEFRAFGFPFDRTVSRFAESFEIVRRLLLGEHVTFEGEFETVTDAVLLPPPARTVPIMLGSNGTRMLGIALPYVDAWNTWFTSYGNTVEGFASLRGDVDAACVRAGRDPAELAHSACVLVRIGAGAGVRPQDIPAVAPADLEGHLRLLGEAGADEAILVLDPIDERATREVANAIVDLR